MSKFILITRAVSHFPASYVLYTGLQMIGGLNTPPKKK